MNNELFQILDQIKSGKAFYIMQKIKGFHFEVLDTEIEITTHKVQKKLIMNCHADIGNYVAGDLIQNIIKKYKPEIEKFNNILYLNCCYGGSKEGTVEGVKVIPINYSQLPSCKYRNKDYMIWYCERPNELKRFYNNVVKNFKMELKIAPAEKFKGNKFWDYIDSEEMFKPFDEGNYITIKD